MYKFIKAEENIIKGNTVSSEAYPLILKAIADKTFFRPSFTSYAHVTNVKTDEIIYAINNRKIYSLKTFKDSKPGQKLTKTNQSTNTDDYSLEELKNNAEADIYGWKGILTGSITNNACPPIVTCPICNGTGICTSCDGKGYVKCEVCDGTGTIDCDECRGSGLCDNCNGSGQVDCPECYGRGRIDCPDCNGRGYVRCPYCNGLGKYERNGELIECEECHGTGRQICTYCKGTGHCTCPKCNGEGYIECKECHGTGDCQICNGTGKLECEECNGTGSVTCDECHGTGKCSECNGKKKIVCPKCDGTGYYQSFTGYKISNSVSCNDYCSMPAFADAITKGRMVKLETIVRTNDRNKHKSIKGSLQDIEEKMNDKDYSVLKSWLLKFPIELTDEQIYMTEETSIYRTPLVEIQYQVGDKIYKCYVIISDRVIAFDPQNMPSRWNVMNAMKNAVASFFRRKK